MQRLFKQGVSKVVKERAEEMDDMAKKASLYVMDAFAGRWDLAFFVCSFHLVRVICTLVFAYPPV